MAENEARDLPECFIPTASYNRAIRGPLTILIGRRGSGKTAMLYAISSKLGNNKNKHVTILKPDGYETHGLIRVLESAKQWSEHGYLIESLWKFLIYSEIAKNLKRKLADRPIHQSTFQLWNQQSWNTARPTRRFLVHQCLNYLRTLFLCMEGIDGMCLCKLSNACGLAKTCMTDS